jgi:predicted lipoprotein
MSRGRVMVGGVLLVVGIIVCYFFPLFHIRPIGSGLAESSGQSATSSQSGARDPAAYVRNIWEGRLRTGTGATEITQLWNAYDADKASAQRKYGRQVALGGAWYFCIRGQGTVTSVEKNRCIVAVAESPRHACLDLGVIVDNTVRDAVGADVNDFANAQDFNAVSSELNRRVELDVIAPNRPLLEPGVRVEFVGCAKIGGDLDLDPLCLVPIRLVVQVNGNLGEVSNGDSGAGGSP